MGRCEALDGEGVVTHFFFIGPFFVPLDTVYAIGRWRGARGFQVKRHMKSIALAYLRWIVAPLVLGITFLASSGEQAGPPRLTGTSEVTLAIMACVWLCFVFLVGRTWGREARQRRFLIACVGHGAPPELLFSGTLSLGLEHLEQAWGELAAREESYRSDATGTLSWRDLYPKDVSERTLPLYYALCRYEAALSEDQVMTNRARLAWQRIEESWPKLETFASRERTRRPVQIDRDAEAR